MIFFIIIKPIKPRINQIKPITWIITISDLNDLAFIEMKMCCHGSGLNKKIYIYLLLIPRLKP